VAVRRQAFEAVGGFDESFFLYFEDADICYRLTMTGWEVHFTPVVTAVHIGGASTMQRRAEMEVQVVASTLQFYQRHLSKTRYAQVVTIIKSIMLARWISRTLALYLARDVAKREKIIEQLAATRRVLFGEWQVQRDGQSPRKINDSVGAS
jgi:GT2 family glycosyltransferase